MLISRVADSAPAEFLASLQVSRQRHGGRNISLSCASRLLSA